MIIRYSFSLIVAVVCALVTSIPASAQQTEDTPLSSLLPELILGEIRLPAPGGNVLSHEAHFSPLSANDPNNPAVAIVQSFNTQFLAQLSSFPLGSSTGGLTYTFDSTLGTFRRGSSSFGPAFAERALTIGRRRLSAGFNYQHTSFSSFEGLSLDDGSVKFYLRHQECCGVGGAEGPPFFGTNPVPDGSRETPFFEGDLIEAALSLEAKTDTVSLFANYGLSERWDVGIAVPIVHVALDAHVVATILRLATSTNPNIHTFEAGNPNATTTTIPREDSATGLGDIVLRTKYRVIDVPGGGLGVGADFRVPTGDQDELLGSGGQTRLYFVASTGQDRFAQHVNIGYTIAAGELPDVAFAIGSTPSNVPNEFGYAAGVELVATPRVTVLGDIVGRTLLDVGRLSLAEKTFAFQMPGPPASPPHMASFEELEPRPGNLNLVYGTAGVKANVWGDLLVSANVLFPFVDAGLRSRLTVAVGVDFAF
jgi:Putative MetA-pathway of phenol degradation